VWVRSAGNTADQAEAQVAMDFPIVAPPASTPPPPPPPPPSGTGDAPPPSTSTKVSYLSIAASKASPQAPGTTITFTASPIGGIAPHQFQWWLHDGTTWKVIRDWNASNTYSWTPGAAYPKYKINVHVRSAGKTSNIEEAKAGLEFAISSTAPPSTAPPPNTLNRATTVTLTSNLASPQNRGTSITWTASAVSGGTAPYQYKFYVFDSASWVVARGWSTSNTFTWTPPLANPYYKVSVQVRSAGNTSDDYEAVATSGLFQIK
jgi:N-acetylmuramoyl-L-alanine amidase